MKLFAIEITYANHPDRNVKDTVSEDKLNKIVGESLASMAIEESESCEISFEIILRNDLAKTVILFDKECQYK